MCVAWFGFVQQHLFPHQKPTLRRTLIMEEEALESVMVEESVMVDLDIVAEEGLVPEVALVAEVVMRMLVMVTIIRDTSVEAVVAVCMATLTNTGPHIFTRPSLCSLIKNETRLYLVFRNMQNTWIETNRNKQTCMITIEKNKIIVIYLINNFILILNTNMFN